jgi:hypothetical protein
LAFRLKYLADHVDEFVIFESNFSFSGREKDYLAKQAIERSGIDNGKIRLVRYQPPPKLVATAHIDRWPLERFARSCLEREVLSYDSSSRFLISDVDEIPSISQLVNSWNHEKGVLLPTPLYLRYLNWKVPHGSDWNTAKILRKQDVRNLNLLRYSKSYPTSRAEPGGHFSFLSRNWNEVSQKLEDWAHREYSVGDDETEIAIKFSEQYLVDHLGRFNRWGYGLIEVQGISELSEIQRALLEFQPDYFFEPKKTYSKLTRIKASLVLTESWTDKSFSKIEEKMRETGLRILMSEILRTIPKQLKLFLKRSRLGNMLRVLFGNEMGQKLSC